MRMITGMTLELVDQTRGKNVIAVIVIVATQETADLQSRTVWTSQTPELIGEETVWTP